MRPHATLALLLLLQAAAFLALQDLAFLLASRVEFSQVKLVDEAIKAAVILGAAAAWLRSWIALGRRLYKKLAGASSRPRAPPRAGSSRGS